jgi:hypothetical protein
MMKLLIAAILAVTPTNSSEMRRQAHCPDYSSIVAYVGFPLAERSQAHKVMHRESRCLPYVFNSKDPNGGSIGLFQINMFWCKPSRYFEDGWLQFQGIVDDCSDLYNPLTNAFAAKAIFDYSFDRNGSGWHPWRV